MFSRITVVFSAFEEVLVDSLVVTGVVESVSGDGSVPVDKVGARVPVGEEHLARLVPVVLRTAKDSLSHPAHHRDGQL